MQTYQVKLHPQSAKIINNVSNAINIDPSLLIEQTLESVAQAFHKFLTIQHKTSNEQDIFDEVIGSIDLKTKKKKSYARKKDIAYLQD